MMPHFIVRYRGEGPRPADMVDRIRSLPDLRVLDDESPRMLLVEAPEGPLRQLLSDRSDWLVAEQQAYRVPDTRPRVDGPPRAH